MNRTTVTHYTLQIFALLPSFIYPSTFTHHICMMNKLLCWPLIGTRYARCPTYSGLGNIPWRWEIISWGLLFSFMCMAVFIKRRWHYSVLFQMMIVQILQARLVTMKDILWMMCSGHAQQCFRRGMYIWYLLLWSLLSFILNVAAGCKGRVLLLQFSSSYSVILVCLNFRKNGRHCLKKVTKVAGRCNKWTAYFIIFGHVYIIQCTCFCPSFSFSN